VLLGDERLSGDLIVDATGRGSHTPHWLQMMGYEKSREDIVQVALGYTTRFFRRRADDLDGDVAAVIPSTPEGKRGGVILAQEGDRWAVTLFAHFGSYAPEDLEGFIDFATTLPAPYIHEVIRHAEPIGEAATIRFPASVRRRYEDLAHFPAGYLVLGDAVCSFNPIYGQGMSVAALEAMELRKVLARKSGDLAKSFFAHAAKVIDIPWSIAVGNDLRMDQTVGSRTIAGKFINWYISKLHKAAHGDPVLALAFLKVSNLLASPSALLHPRVAWRVFLSRLASSFRERAQHARIKAQQKETAS
jgi:flavin-dependent dehydrogenase